MPVLLIEKGKNKGKSFEIPKAGPLIAGREKGSDVRLSDSMCSRKHFQVKNTGEAYVLSDLDSSNGTFVNGQRITGSVNLEFGDKVQAGDTIMSFLERHEGKSAGTLAGVTLGGYLLEQRIGRGGMGTVYKALQVSLDRPVALKILSKEFVSDKNFIKMFIKEARAAGQLNHPNIVQVYDVGNIGDTYFFSMEYVGGGSVEEILNKHGRLSTGQALPIIIDSAKGLEYAERKQIVHCDIKPDNLMLTEDNVVKIGDLGIAKSMAAGEHQVKSEGISGSPHYIAPEQATARPVDVRTDIYSLGCSFFQILTGKTPYSGKTPKEIILKQINEPTPDIRQIEPSVPAQVANLVNRMMEKDPAKRPQGATELLVELINLQKKFPPEKIGDIAMETSADMTAEPGKKWLYPALAAGAAALVIIVFALVFALSGGGGGEIDLKNELIRKMGEANALAKRHKYQEAKKAYMALWSDNKYKDCKKELGVIRDELISLDKRIAEIAQNSQDEVEKRAERELSRMISGSYDKNSMQELDQRLSGLEEFVGIEEYEDTRAHEAARQMIGVVKKEIEELEEKIARQAEKKRELQERYQEVLKGSDLHASQGHYGLAVRMMQSFHSECALEDVKKLAADKIEDYRRMAERAYGRIIQRVNSACSQGNHDYAKRLLKDEVIGKYDLSELTERANRKIREINDAVKAIKDREYRKLLAEDKKVFDKAWKKAREAAREANFSTASGEFRTVAYSMKTDVYKDLIQKELRGAELIEKMKEKTIHALTGMKKGRIRLVLKNRSGFIVGADDLFVKLQLEGEEVVEKHFWKNVEPEKFIRIVRDCELDAEGVFGLGLYCRLLGMDSEARAEFTKAVRKKPSLRKEVARYRK